MLVCARVLIIQMEPFAFAELVALEYQVLPIGEVKHSLFLITAAWPTTAHRRINGMKARVLRDIFRIERLPEEGSVKRIPHEAFLPTGEGGGSRICCRRRLALKGQYRDLRTAYRDLRDTYGIWGTHIPGSEDIFTGF